MEDLLFDISFSFECLFEFRYVVLHDLHTSSESGGFRISQTWAFEVRLPGNYMVMIGLRAVRHSGFSR